jgi:uncharacterized protein with von Willebrand factor type A (vWA) domain
MNLAANILQFGRLLQRAGLDVHHARLLDAIRALAWVDIGSRADMAATLRGLLVHDRNDLDRFDRAFDLFFRAHRPPASGPPLFSLGERPRVVARASDGSPIHAELDDVESTSRYLPSGRAIGAWSAAGISRTKDFGEFSERELEQARMLLERLPWAVGRRQTRRWRCASSGTPDLRPFLRDNLMRGDLVDLPRRAPREAARPIVLLGDVSGSMERYSRMLVHFVYGLSRSHAVVETFFFATRLTRVTHYLRRHRGPRAAARLGREVQDWGGGTRIGDSLRTFNTQWARRVMRNGPVVLIVSDGWDRGEPEVIDREIARLRRRCRRLIWLNPLLGNTSYEPLTRGMQAALRHIDDFLPVHNLASLERLADHLRSLPDAKGRPWT